MSAAAAVRDAGTPHRMLRAANARIGNRAIGLAELGQRDTGELGPERVRSIEVQTLVEVESNPSTATRPRRKIGAARRRRGRSSGGRCSRTGPRRRSCCPRPRTALRRRPVGRAQMAGRSALGPRPRIARSPLAYAAGVDDDLPPVSHCPMIEERCDRQAGTIYSPSR